MKLSFKLNPTLETLPVYHPGGRLKKSRVNSVSPLSKSLSWRRTKIRSGRRQSAGGDSEGGRQFICIRMATRFISNRSSRRNLGVEPSKSDSRKRFERNHRVLGHALIAPGDDVVVSQYCFAIYPIVAKIVRGECNQRSGKKIRTRFARDAQGHHAKHKGDVCGESE